MDSPKQLLSDPILFARAGGITLRSYQVDVARAVVDSVLNGRGRAFAVMFPRQSGKNELQAQIEAYLLYLLQFKNADLIKISPTWAPQSLNAMRRLERVLAAHPWTRGIWHKESGNIFRIGRARITFLSGAPGANIVGATASHLLEVDEAQDVAISKYDKDAAPMASSTNATRVFWGTAWTAQTLLAREVRSARQEEERAGQDRLAFTLTAEQVAREAPSYGAFVAGQVARLGRTHPMVRTQYFSEEIEGQGGMFPEARVELMRPGGPQPPGLAVPNSGAGRKEQMPVAFLLDVAGEDEAQVDISGENGARRDATALTIVGVDRAALADPLLRAPVYRVLERRAWVGVRHTRLYGEIRALAEGWQPRWLVVDATGVGAGLASFLARALPGKVIPFIFSAQSKSKLGWDFLEIVDAGRWRDLPSGGSEEQDRLRALFFRQLAFCQYSIQPGPGRVMRWGVPDGARDPASGAYVHDDLLLSAALCALLEELDWSPRAGADPGVVRAKDPLVEMKGF